MRNGASAGVCSALAMTASPASLPSFPPVALPCSVRCIAASSGGGEVSSGVSNRPQRRSATPTSTRLEIIVRNATAAVPRAPASSTRYSAALASGSRHPRGGRAASASGVGPAPRRRARRDHRDFARSTSPGGQRACQHEGGVKYHHRRRQQHAEDLLKQQAQQQPRCAAEGTTAWAVHQRDCGAQHLGQQAARRWLPSGAP